MAIPQLGGGFDQMFFGGNPQTQALLTLGLGMLAARDKGAGFGDGAFNAYQTASNNYRGAQDQAFRNTLLKRQMDREDQQAATQQKAAQRTERQSDAVTAGRISAGIGGAQDKAAYWNMVRGMPEVQDALKAYGIDPATVTPETLPQIQQQLATSSQIGGPVVAPRDLQLKAIVGPDGKPMFVPEQMAIGQTPYEKTSEPTSWEEYLRAQKDPAFRKFLQERKSKGLSVTLPDGTVVEMGGDQSKVGAGELSKPTINNLQETIVNSTNRLDRLNQTLTTYNPDFLRAAGVIDAKKIKIKDFLGMNVSPEQKKYLSQYAEFQANAAQDFNQTLKELSGVAVNEHELKRAQDAAPSGTDMSPVEFESKARATTKFVTRAIMRANWALKNGIGVQSVDQLSKAMPLEGIDAVYEKRANEIWQQLGGTPDVKAKAIQQANQEFGLAR